MKLYKLLDPDLVSIDLRAGTKSEAIAELLDLAIVKHPELQREGILKSIYEREEIENTSYGRGFAFPHARTELVDKMYVALGISRKGLGDNTLDGEPLRVICLMLTPSNIAKFYLQTLSALAAFARTPGNMQKLLESRSVDQLIRTIDESGVEITKELLVRNIMSHRLFTASPETTLKEVANLLFRHKVSGLPVVDSSGKLLGEITNRDLIRAALPDYKSLISNPAMSYESEPFEDLLRSEDKIKVKDLMNTDVVTVTEDTPVVELAALMLFKNLRRVPVVRDDRLVGLVVVSDIVSKIIRG